MLLTLNSEGTLTAAGQQTRDGAALMLCCALQGEAYACQAVCLDAVLLVCQDRATHSIQAAHLGRRTLPVCDVSKGGGACIYALLAWLLPGC